MKRSSSSYAVVRRHFALTQLFVFVAGMLHTTLAVQAGTFTVTNTDDSGAGSLRQAIVDANASPGLDTIAFNIPGGGVKTIYVTAALTGISSPVIIDGYTQPGTSLNTLATGNDAVLLVELTTTNNSQGINFLTSGCSARGLVINGFSQGVAFQAAAQSNVVEGCFIGTDSTGTNVSPRAITTGIQCASANNRIGGTNVWQRNLISGCADSGIYTVNAIATGNLIVNNYIGTDRHGTAAIPNSYGIQANAPLGQIGGTNAASRNLISGNLQDGIYITAASNIVEGCYIGTDITGINALPNGNINAAGLSMNSFGNRVGGANPGARNIISGNLGFGVNSRGGATNSVIGNFIGVDVTGTNALPNTGAGVNVRQTSGVIVSNNVVSANLGTGVQVVQATRCQVRDNRIGTDASGTLALGNGQLGINANSSSHFHDITGNVIAYNGTDGFHSGISFNNGALSNNVINNLIHDNAGRGIDNQLTARYNQFAANELYNNGGLGIDVDGDGVPTLNDPCDGDSGDNNQQNFPVISASTSTVSSVTIDGFLDSAPSKTYRLDFFSNTACDPSGFGEGETFLGTTNVTTGANCTNNFTVTFPVAVADAMLITATATDSDGSTSEFSACRTNISSVVTAACALVPQLSTNTVGQIHSVTSIIATNGTPAAGVTVSFSVTGAHAIGATNIVTAGNGQASFAYTGSNTGTDTIFANGSVGGSEFGCTANMVWLDNSVPPQITCPSNITTTTAAGQCSRAVSFTATATGTPTPTVTCAPPSGSVFLSGAELVSCVASNSAGTDNCEFTVTVNDLQSPTVNCPANIATNVPAGVTSANVTFLTPTGSDNCAISQVVCAPSSGSSFALGTTAVTCTATDTSDNTGQCSFNVTVTQNAASANLGIAKTVNSPTIALGSNVVYTVTVTNAGPNTAESVAVGDALPGMLDFVSASTSQGDCTYDNGLVSCQLGALATGGVVGIQIEAETRGIGTNCNYAVVASATADPVSANNRAGACTVVYRPLTGADLSLTKAAVPDSMIISNTVAFEVRVQNLGPDPATAVQVNDVLPAGLEYVSATTTRGSCAENLGTITCDLGAMGVQSNATLWVTVRGVELGETCNEAEVTSGTADPLLSNNADTACVEVRADREKDHDLAVTKIIAPHTITFTGAKTRIRELVGVQIQNRGPHAETIKNATVLAGLVTLTADSLGSCPAPEIKLTVGGPQVALPLRLEPKQKATVWYDVKFVRSCVNDPEQSSAADPGHEDYRWIAVVDHAAINGKADTNPEDDVCPRYGRPPFPRTPNAPSTIREKGCGGNAPDGSARGGDVLTDVVVP